MSPTVRIKIFQKSSHLMIETEFNSWVREREEVFHRAEAPVFDPEDVVTESALTKVLNIPPQTHLSFDQSLQKYILTVLYHTYVDKNGVCLD